MNAPGGRGAGYLRRAVDAVETWVGARGRAFRERREMVERRRSATWQVTIALIVSTLGAVGLGYLVVQLFFLPETIAQAQLNRVPDLTGLSLEDARRAGGASGYPVLASGIVHDAEVDSGDVVFQTPLPDTYHPRGDTLHALLSLGPARPVVPDLAGLDPELARSILRQLDLQVTEPRREASDVHPQGTVIETVPPAGTRIEDDTVVTLVLSRGGSFLTMPDVRGLDVRAARDTLELYSLTVGEVIGIEGEPLAAQRFEADRQVVVTAQEPAFGRRIRSGIAVRLTLGERRRERPAGAPDVAPPPRREPLAVPRRDAPRADTAPPTGETPPADGPDDDTPF